MNEYKEFDLGIVFRSKKIDSAITTLWQEFYQRLSKLPVTIDRAIWIFNRCPFMVAVKPGFLDESEYEEPHFVLAAEISGLDEEVNDISANEARGLNSPAVDKLYAEYERWLREAVKTTFQSPKIKKLRNEYSKKDLAVYWTAIPDIHSQEIDEMTWLVGSKLK